MDRDEFLNSKFITVAGRAESMDEFIDEVKKNLYDNYEVVAVHGLGEFGIDDKERYLAFITGESETGHTFNAQERKLITAQLGARTHNSIDEAYDFSKETYPTFGEDQIHIQEKHKEMAERFPSAKAVEVEQFHLLESLWANGRISFVRCRLDDKPCLVLISITPGVDELRVRPFAIMMNEELESRLEFPDPDAE
jgi:hypothetical protein